MGKIDLIALDLDGTFLDPAGEISPASLEAVQAARATGVKVVLSTGRSGWEAAHFSKLAGCDSLAVCLGGAALCDARTGRHLRRWDLPEETIELMIFAGEEILLDPFSRRSLQRTYPFSVFHSRAVDTPDPLAYLAEHGLPLTKLHGDQKPGGYPLEELAALPGVSLTASNDHDFELVPAGVNKGRALALLALMWGIPLERCAAVGDSANDLEMLQAVGCPIAMGNAAPQVQAAAVALWRTTAMTARPRPFSPAWSKPLQAPGRPSGRLGAFLSAETARSDIFSLTFPQVEGVP